VTGNSGAYASSITYHASGVPNTVPHANGTREIWGADAYKLPRPSSISVLNNSNVMLWSSGAYTYDGSGNITQIGDSTATHTNYTYDAFNRLTGWNTSNPDGSYNLTGVGYDAYGNWLHNAFSFCGPNGPIRRCGGSSVVAAQLVGTTNHYVGVGYDDAGNVTSDGSFDYARTFTYDSTGMLMRAAIRGHDYRFLYTAAGERIAIVERVTGADNIIRNKTTFTLRGSGNQLLSTWVSDAYTNALAWTEDDIWRGAHLLARETPSGTQHYSLDHVGSPRLITNASGLQVGTQEYAPFGIGGTTGSGMLQFTAQERDAANVAGGEYGMPDYFHARYYDANRGRFVSVDPSLNLKGAMTYPQSWNRYAYVENNPLNLTDPDGRNASVVCRTTTDKQGNSTTNCTATVEAQIVVTNSAERAAARQFARDARAYWNRQTARGQNGENIRFNVRFNIVGPNQEQA
jgi:RHS repeat-associated protein